MLYTYEEEIMIESKNIKVIDEHNIDRTANKICVIDVDGSDYIIYSIERDSDNDNIFVSKLLSNINGTSNMINIEDSMEKEKMATLVKELIKYAVDTDKDNVDTSEIILASGKKISFVSKNIDKKEQNINVQKTYITTVKKAVTKVTEDFYKIKEEEKVEEPVSDIFPVFETPKDTHDDVLPDIIPNIVSPVVETVSAPVVESPVVEEPKVEEVKEDVPTQIIPETPSINIPNTEEVKVEMPSMEIKPVSEINVTEQVNTPSEPTMILPTPEAVVKPVEPSIPVSPIMPTSVVPPVTEPINTSVVESPVASTPIPEPVQKSDNVLVFDGSKESNLNEALGEISNDKTVITQNVEPIREFGVDETKPVVENTVTEPAVAPVSTGRGRAGFANNKFFMVIAILFFVSACVFLGYEAFRYFSLVK